MTAATLATASTREMGLAAEPARRIGTAEAPRPFKEVLGDAEKAGSARVVREEEREEPAAKDVDRAEGVAEGAPAAEQAPASNEVEGESPEDEQVSREEGAEPAPEAQKLTDGGGAPSQMVDQPRREEAASRIGRSDAQQDGEAGHVVDSQAAGARAGELRASASPAAAAQQTATTATNGEPNSAAPQATPPPHVIDAPPTVHRLNELLLTMDRRALEAAGVLRHHSITDPGTPTEVGVPEPQDTGSSWRGMRASLSVPRRDAPMHHAGTERTSHEASKAPATSIAAARDNHNAVDDRPGAAPSEQPSRQRHPDAGTRPTAPVAASAARSQLPDPLARLDASFRGVARLAAVTPAGEAGATSAGASGGLHVRDAGPASLRSGTPPAPARGPAVRTEEAFQAQLSRGMSAAVAQRGGRVTLRLTPEALGDLKIDMTVKEGVVSARFEAATSEARELLDRSMEHLREVLHAKGLHVERLEVREHAAEPLRTDADGQHRADTDAGARSQHHGGQEAGPGGTGDERGAQERPAPGRGWDAAESASEPVSGAPPEDGAAAWRIGVDAIA